MLEVNRRAARKLGSAVTVAQFWSAAQALIAQAAPGSMRWLCLRPIRMTTAMVFLRETVSGPAGFPCEPKSVALADGEAVIVKDLFAHHPAIGRFRENAGLALAHLDREEIRSVNARKDFWPGVSEIHAGVALAFWERKRLHGMVLLHRAPEEGDFSGAEISALRELHTHLESAVCRIMATRRLAAQKQLFAGIVKSLPLPLVLCDARLKILCESPLGLEARMAWQTGRDNDRALALSGGRQLAPDLNEFCLSRIKKWENANTSVRRKIEQEKIALTHSQSPGLQVEVRMLRPKGFPLVQPFFLLQFARPRVAPSRINLDSGELVWLSLLSTREREIAELVCGGHSNAAISRQLRKSVHTVKAQLQSIFRKLEITGRSSLITMALRTPAEGLPFSRGKSGTRRERTQSGTPTRQLNLDRCVDAFLMLSGDFCQIA